MQAFWKSMVGTGNRKTTVVGVGAILAAIGMFLQTGELNVEQFGIGLSGLVGLFARGGGTGSDAA